MARILWDQTGEKIYETGVDRGVLFPIKSDGTYEAGVAWNGLTSVSENPTGAEATPLYADGIKYVNLMSAEEFGCTIGAYTYPDEFAECDGSYTLADGVTIGQQTRKQFGFSYRTLVGNDVQGNDYGYKIHIVYGCLASPSTKEHSTVNDSPAAEEFSWEVNTTKIQFGDKMTSSITIDSTKVDATKLKELEDMLYGAAEKEPKLPMPSDLTALFPTTQA